MPPLGIRDLAAAIAAIDLAAILAGCATTGGYAYDDGGYGSYVRYRTFCAETGQSQSARFSSSVAGKSQGDRTSGMGWEADVSRVTTFPAIHH